MNQGKAIYFHVSPADLAKILARCTVDPETGCWIWPGAKDQKGYAQARVNGHPHPVRLSRLMRHCFRHDLPEKLTVNHADNCRNPRCINPDHLPPLGRPENTADGNHARRVKRMAKMLGRCIRELSAQVALSGHEDPRAMALVADATIYIKSLPKALRPKRRRRAKA